MLRTADFEARARQVLSREAWEFYAEGADDEQTLRENVRAFGRYRLRPRMLRGVSSVNTATSLLGEGVSFPVGISPTAFHRVAHPDGEAATARASSKMKVCNIVSNWSTTKMADIVSVSKGGLLWMQMAPYSNRDYQLRLVRQAERAGFKALVLTVDVPVAGKRLGSLRNKFSPPLDSAFAMFHDVINTAEGSAEKGSFFHVMSQMNYPGMSWDDVDWLRSSTHLPIVLKGLLTAEDAKEALRHGIQAIMVSNHGGRQLDSTLATIDAVEEVVRAVEGSVEVYMDGGVRQGTDVLKALALGARAVFIGRPVLWGLACNGADGVTQVLQILKDELQRAMILCGCSTLSDIKPELVVHQSLL